MSKDIHINLQFISKNFQDLDEDEKELVGFAEKALESSYSPYSGFRVGAAMLLENGSVVSGSNQENAAFPTGLCAERVTLFKSTSEYPGTVIRKLAVLTAAQKEAHPCGACRQALLEFEINQEKPIKVIMQTSPETYLISDSVEHLLPLAFKTYR